MFLVSYWSNGFLFYYPLWDCFLLCMSILVDLVVVFDYMLVVICIYKCLIILFLLVPRFIGLFL